MDCPGCQLWGGGGQVLQSLISYGGKKGPNRDFQTKQVAWERGKAGGDII